MRHIVVHDPDFADWAVVDTESAHMVISFHRSRNAAVNAATVEERDWPSRAGTDQAKAA